MTPGTKLGRYEIRSKIGEGGMGEVYLAEDTKLDRKVALKVLPSEVATHPERMRRFVQEAKAASALNHPNIITIYEIDETDSGHFIATEFIDGETLRERIRRAPIKPVDALDAAVQIASALSAAHAAGIVHRDIKSENIMVRRDGIVKVLDFGLAKLTEQRSPESVDREAATRANIKTEPGVVMGTVAYMSPEQARGEELDARTDIWSLGVVLYEMMAGRTPFRGETNSHTVVSILESEPGSLTTFGSDVPAELNRIVRKALTKDRESRYQTARDLMIDIKSLRRELDLHAELGRGGWAREIEQSGQAQTLVADRAPWTHASAGKVQQESITELRSVSSAEYLVGEIKRHRVFVFALLALLALAAIAFVVYKFSAAPPAVAKHFTSPQNLKITRLTTSGKVADIAMSPDGKYVAYVIEDAGKLNVRLRQTATASDVEIVAPDENKTQGLSFTPDGVYLYYLRIVQNLGTLYQIPALGGQPKKIVVDADTGAGVSPDGQQIVFARGSETGSMLMVASADGSNQKTLVQFQGNNFFWPYAVPSWSRDGKTIACGAVLQDKDGEHLKLIGVNASDGKWRLLNDRNWSVLAGVQWLPDGSLIVGGNEKSETQFAPLQLWLVTPNAAPQRLTNDLNDYVGASATASGNALVTLRTSIVSNIWIAPNNDATRASQAAPASEIWNGIEWTPDGGLIYCSKAGGKFDIWTMNSGGTNQKQVSSGEGAKYQPQMTPDGRFIVFTLSRNGIENVWRMDADGGNLKQLTSGAGEPDPNISPDGKWIIYQKFENPNTLWKVSIEGGVPVQLTSTLSYSPTVSPRDGMIAYVFNDAAANMLRRVAIISPDGGAPLKTFALPPTANNFKMRFTPDGRALAFLDSRGGGANIWAIALDGNGEAKPLTDFKTEKIFDFAWSLDGKQLAVIRGTAISDAVLISEEK